jgi:NAD(P)H-hydrate repair Nnr-like enzyme with NAD(P)H-hydrate epimerase domain
MIGVAAQTESTTFLTQNGDTVPCCSWETWTQTAHSLHTNGLSPLQMVEACGFSSAMVIRFALGLSSSGGTVTVLASDSFFGWVTLACARHLLNGGSSVHLVIIPSGGEASSPFQCLVPVAVKMGGHLYRWRDPKNYGELTEIIESSHNVLCGLSDGGAGVSEWSKNVIDFMNESAIPVHAVGSPLGLAPDRSVVQRECLYASSTLSLGLPLEVLHHDCDLIGRHYLCDMSWGLRHYKELGFTGEPLFAEQPVIKLVQHTR